MTTIALSTAPLVLNFPEDVNVGEIPRRDYDFNKGDRRFHDRQVAIDHALAEATATGIRQIVRPTSPALLGGAPLYLVQAVGS